MTDEQARSYRRSVETAGEPPDEAATAVRLGNALRRLARVVTGSDAGDQALDEVADEIERLADRLEPHAQPSRYPQAERLGGPSGMFVTHPIVGTINPCAPPMRVTPGETGVVGTVVYGTPFEGPPGYAHGGHIAAGFDVILAMTAGVNGVGGMTRSLSVRYRKPTPLHAELVYEGAIGESTERLTTVTGKLMACDVVCAEAVGEFARRPPAG